MNPQPDSLNQALVLDALREVEDPELGCNIVDLGLIYGVSVDQGNVTVRMTLTTQGCPMHDSLIYGAKVAVLKLDAVEDVDVELVWDPPWTPERMTDAGRTLLGVKG